MVRRSLLLLLLPGLLMSGCAAGAGSAGEVARRVPPLHPSVDDYPEATLRLINRGGQTVTVEAKVANTAPRRRHGLMEVPALPDGVGMLFVFSAAQRGGFWMKNTLVPLDAAFVASDGTIRVILRMEPCTSARCPGYDPGVPYRYALEVRGGWFEQVGVDEGARLEFPADLPPPFE